MDSDSDKSSDQDGDEKDTKDEKDDTESLLSENAVEMEIYQRILMNDLKVGYLYRRKEEFEPLIDKVIETLVEVASEAIQKYFGTLIGRKEEETPSSPPACTSGSRFCFRC